MGLFQKIHLALQTKTQTFKIIIMKASIILFKSKKVKEQKEGDQVIYFEHPLMLRLTDGKNRKHISLKVSLPVNRWNDFKSDYIPIPTTKNMSEKERDEVDQKNAAIRNLISSTLDKYNRKIDELATSQRHVSLDTLLKMVEQPAKHDYNLFQWFEKLIGEYRAMNKTGQVRVYKSALGALKTFLNDKDIAFDEIDVAFLERFERHLLKQNVSAAGMSFYIRTLRAALNQAIKQGYAKNYPFNAYSVPKGKPNKRALSVEDMKLLLKKKQDNDNYRMMVFCYYTVGMNYVDMVRLKWSNIVGNEIRYVRQKIHHRMTIPIHDKVREVLNYYKPITGTMPHISGKNENYIFPILNDKIHVTEQQIADRVQKKRKQFNNYLGDLGEAAGVQEDVTSYVLRHSAITHLVRKGITIDAIQALAGHARISTTENYFREATETQKKKAINQL